MRTPVIGDRDQRLHALRDRVGEKNDLAIDVARGPSRGLDQRSLAAQESLFVGIEDADQRDFRKIESFAEEIDADKNIEVGRAQATQDFHALDRVDIAVQITHLQSHIAQIIRQIFGRALRQRRNENALLFFDPLPAKLNRLIDLVLERFQGDSRIEQSRWPNNLLDHEWCSRGMNVEFFGRLVRSADDRFPVRRSVFLYRRSAVRRPPLQIPPPPQTAPLLPPRSAPVCAGSIPRSQQCCS